DKCCDECDCNSDEDVDDDKCKCGCGESVEEESTADAYFRQLLTLRAEFDNYRKRTQNDISKAYSNGFNEAITEFLPALDSFKMATEYITDPNTLMGIQYIEKGILSTLEKKGITVIDVSGKFDPNFHQAIGSEVSDEHESGDIIKECFKGFMMGDKVIRYSQVIVAK
ncbi:MAG: nucleotide exchange factor GrpE, partial [Clostridia bacterium]|nr:nucleotide exchange factor GrpE [Clostridia bacterium]